jgi:hypothetical protein
LRRHHPGDLSRAFPLCVAYRRSNSPAPPARHRLSEPDWAPIEPPEPWTYISDESVEITFKAKVDAESSAVRGVPKGKAGVSLQFKREKAIVFTALGGTIQRIRDIYHLQQQLVTQSVRERGLREMAFVTEVVTVDSGRVLISLAADGNFTASASADFTQGVVDLANASIGVSEVSRRHVSVELQPGAKATPLLNGFKLHHNLPDDLDAFLALPESDRVIPLAPEEELSTSA